MYNLKKNKIMKYLKTFEELTPGIYKRAAAGIRKRDEKDRSQRKKLGMRDEYEEDFLLDKDGNLVKDEKGNFIRKADASAKNLEDHAKEREGKYDGKIYHLDKTDNGGKKINGNISR